MSLLDDPTDVVAVYPEVDSVDGDDNPIRVPAEQPVRVGGRVQPASADETRDRGYKAGTYYRFIGRSFPRGAYARVEWAGREWDVDGEPLLSRGSEATRHVTVMLRAREPQEVC